MDYRTCDVSWYEIGKENEGKNGSTIVQNIQKYCKVTMVMKFRSVPITWKNLMEVILVQPHRGIFPMKAVIC